MVSSSVLPEKCQNCRHSKGLLLAQGNPFRYKVMLNSQEASCYNLQGINEQSGTYGNKRQHSALIPRSLMHPLTEEIIRVNCSYKAALAGALSCGSWIVLQIHLFLDGFKVASRRAAHGHASPQQPCQCRSAARQLAAAVASVLKRKQLRVSSQM